VNASGSALAPEGRSEVIDGWFVSLFDGQGAGRGVRGAAGLFAAEVVVRV
jgi:hypothetical protein